MRKPKVHGRGGRKRHRLGEFWSHPFWSTQHEPLARAVLEEVSANCAQRPPPGPCGAGGGAVGSLLHRARSASRSKPLPGAVGGSRRFMGEVDESATGSVN